MIVAVIPAKEGSTRLPQKNMMEVDGAPLVVHAIRQARSVRQVEKVYVSTDSDAIAALAEENGAGVVRRGADLAGDTALIDVYCHALNAIGEEGITHILGVQPDHPGRKSDMDGSIDYALANDIDDLFTVDRHGKRNGALRLLSVKALRARPTIYPSAYRDDCVNIHTRTDLALADHERSPFSREIAVEGHRIGPGHPTFIIAEAACNHMCDVDMAKKMIDLAAEAGADAIKFQTYKAERLARREAKLYWEGKETSQIEYYGRLDRFGAAEYETLFAHAREKGIIGFSTPFDPENASMLNDLGMPLFKIASCDLPDSRLLRRVAGFGKPVILSVGGANTEEIDRAVATIFETGNHQLVLMSCMLSYPTPDENADLLRIRALKDRYPDIIIGLSDHTEPDPNMVIPALGAALGASAIEKHYTLDRSKTGSGHFFSVTPEDLKAMVANIRLAERVLGEGRLEVAEVEEAARGSARRSIVAERPIRSGEVIDSSMLGMKRPADGLPGWMIDQVVGKRAKRDIGADEALSLDIVE
ncbi:MAG: N-acetylneuraminate synthase family protein [bacterium]